MQPSSRRYRPQTFAEIKGQDLVVRVLKNAIAFQRAGQAYLFSGIRGTGKTTLARVFAKALNCLSLQEDSEPCNQCALCKEIISGTSVDFMEIDGASYRGIDDIRKVNDTLPFAPIKSKYKIYLIDEAHMLTKEAFNSLLKSLEEPPQHVKFFLATTEMHKIPETILSRCQKIQIKRLSEELITEKLLDICGQHNIPASKEALHPIAQCAQGSLRDAESLYDYVISLFPDQLLDAHKVAEALGMTSTVTLQSLVTAIHTKNYEQALAPITSLIDSGVSPTTFLHDLTQFYLQLLIQNQQPQAPLHSLAKQYSQDTLLEIIDFLGESAKFLQNTIFEKTFLETLIIRLIKLSSRPTLAQIVSQLQATPQQHTPAPGSNPQQEQLSLPSPPPAPPQEQVIQQEENILDKKEAAVLETLLRFAEVEFSGTITKH